MNQAKRGVDRVPILLIPDEFTLLRNHFAAQEKLSPDEAKRVYSDSILQAAAVADPVMYTSWHAEALTTYCGN